MKTQLVIVVIGGWLLLGCGQEGPGAGGDLPTAASQPAAPQHRSNLPPLHPDNIVSIASNSPDHTTLVTALKAADYLTAVAASGPLTVFAPTNAAFDKLPPGTVESLLEPENADQLREVLKYHVTTSSLAASSFRDGQTLGMANGDKAAMSVNGDEVAINGVAIVASIPASNGMVHVIEAVLLPPEE